MKNAAYYKSLPSETDKYLDLTQPYCIGNGVDVGSQGRPVVPWAIQVELPAAEYATYTSGKVLEQAGVWRGTGLELPFKDGVMDFCYSSHLLEDFADWEPALREWARVVRVGGYLVVLTPEDGLWDAAVAAGQPPNCAHKHCGRVGEIKATVEKVAPGRFEHVRDGLTALFEGDYSILYVGERVA